MKENKLIDILNKHTGYYINNIARELEQTHDKWFDNFGFPMFGVTSKDYFEQVYFQSYLESYTRNMINSILKEMFDEEIEDRIRWPELDYAGFYIGYTNKECEEKFGFEFINTDKRVGYRYSHFYYDQIDELLKREKIECVKLITWEEDFPSFMYDDERAKVINLRGLFQEFFGEQCEEEYEKMYDLFVEHVTKAVEQANSMISLTTLPGFTPAYLHRVRNEVVSELQDEVMKLSAFYVKNPSFKNTEEDSQVLIDTYHLTDYFLQKKMEYAFVGSGHFAKSFLTSEYLFRYFKKNPMFDYTPIVSGYIKSIEQLLYAICNSYQFSIGTHENMGSWTMGNYKYYIENHENIIREELIPAKTAIIACLESYRVESRNHLFHRDYFNDWERVEKIRINTIFLYVALLGMIDNSLLEENPRLLSILDQEYDRLFCMIDEDESSFYAIEIGNKEYLGMTKERRYDGIKYAWNGLIRNTIRFQRFDYDHYEKLVISSNNMPSAIWNMDSLGNKKKLLWKATENR